MWNKSTPITIASLFGLFCLVLVASVQPVKAESDLNLKDRLSLPAQYYGTPEQNLFVDLQRVGKRLIAVGARGNIVFSEDDGQSWMPASVSVSTLLTAVYFVDEQLGWAVGHGAVILHSSDGGRSWQKQFDGNEANKLVLDQIQSKYNALQTDYARADESEKEDIAWAMEDLSFALEDAKVDGTIGPAKPLLDVWFKNAQEGYVVGAYGFFFKTLNGGKSWSYVGDALENIDRYHLNAIDELVGGTLIIAGEAGQLFASYDEGASWETLYGPYQGSFFGMQALEEDGSVLVYGLRGHVFKSRDGGQSWQQIKVPVETNLTASAMSSSGKVLIVGFSGAILLSKDQGESFETVRRNNFDAYNAVVFSSESSFVLAGELGIQHANE